MKLRLAVIAAAIAFVIIGSVSGETDAVFRKASQICLECIGIG
jgi:Flp pilus assembly pilin Flp